MTCITRPNSAPHLHPIGTPTFETYITPKRGDNDTLWDVPLVRVKFASYLGGPSLEGTMGPGALRALVKRANKAIGETEAQWEENFNNRE